MKNSILALFAFIVTNVAAQTNVSQFAFPPEWEPQASVWLGWQSRETDSAFCMVQCKMIKAISPYTPVTLLFSSPGMKEAALKLLYSYGLDTTMLRSYFCPIENTWIRDAGPRFLKSNNGQLAIARFKWTLYGYPKELSSHDIIRGQVNDSLSAKMGIPLVYSGMVSEGGGLDISNQCILAFKETALQRNPDKTLEEIELEYLRVLGKKKMIWLNRSPVADKISCGPKTGNYFGWGANGHIDEYARFVNDSTILIAQIDSLDKDKDPVSKTDYTILKENLNILKQATDERGKHFHIITMPCPVLSLYCRKTLLKPEEKNSAVGKCFFKDFKAGDEIYWIPALSYLNYFVTNGLVLVPEYWTKGLPETEKHKDDYVKEVYAKMFPGRKIVQINPLGVNWQGGGMHCISQQQPK